MTRQDYKFGNKNNWRRQLWNELARCAQPPDALALYLPGPQDLDRPIAISKGFKPWNLIAVERNGKVVDKLKLQSIPVVGGDLFQVLRDWNPDRAIDCLIADFTSDATRLIVENLFLHLKFAPHLTNSVVALNFLRGRDKSSNHARSLLIDNFDASYRGQPVNLKHRGLSTVGRIVLLNCGYAAKSGVVKSEQDALAMQRHLLQWSDVSMLATYRSESGQLFDSVVFRNPFGKAASLCQKNVQEQRVSAWRQLLPTITNGKLRATIRAVMAHRTMRTYR